MQNLKGFSDRKSEVNEVMDQINQLVTLWQTLTHVLDFEFGGQLGHRRILNQ